MLKSRRGLALVAVLWGLTLLALMTASFTSTTRTEVNLTFNALQAAKAEALAEAGVHRTILGILTTDEEGEQWRVDDSVYGWRFNGGDIRVSVQDEGGKIDLNAAQNEILRALFISVQVDPARADALVDAILDFRDPDDLRQQNGAEDDDYRAAGLKHDAKDAPFDSIEELNQVYGMTGYLFRQVAPGLTVHSGRPEPFNETATPVALAALQAADFNLEAEEEAEEASRTNVEPEAPGDEIGIEPLADTESAVPVLLREGQTTLRSGVPAYRIHAEGRARSGAVFAIDTVVQVPSPDGGPFAFMTWRRGERRFFPDVLESDLESDLESAAESDAAQ